MGIESSANKIAIGICDSEGKIYSNCWRTFISPPGTGFLPNETAKFHWSKIFEIFMETLNESKLTMKDINLIAYTRGPGMGAPL